jgi:D-alanyl-D-alanine carboxypeptidase
MDPVVPVYSIAKTYTAAAACLSFDLREQVGQHLHSLPPALASLRIRDLLTHRSGLNDYYGWQDRRTAVRANDDPWPAEAVAARAEVDAPGGFRYSNIGYMLVRLALEEIHGDTFFGLLDKLVLSPLGVDAAPFATRADWSACTHPAIDDELRKYHPGWVYPGTFAARVHDAARGIALIMRGELGEEHATAMRDTLPVDVPEHPLSPAGYGLGLMTGGIPPSLVGHGGQGPGFSLFAGSTANGERWHGAVIPDEGEDLDLIRICVETIASEDR